MVSTTTSQKPKSVLRLLVQRARDLYSVPAVAMQVLQLTNDPNVDSRVLKQCIENDPALTAKLLKVVNSSLFGLSREICDLEQAVTLLGLKPLKLLVLGFSLPKQLNDRVQADLLAYFWQHSFVKALAARHFSQKLEQGLPDEAFVAALLQRIGMLTLVQELGGPYVRCWERTRTHGSQLVSLETATLGFDHLVLSARLLDHWKLPKPLVRAIGTPLELPVIEALSDQQQVLPRVLYLADLAADVAVGGNELRLQQLLVAAEPWGLQAEHLHSLVRDLETKVTELAQLFAIRLVDVPAYDDVLDQAYRRLSMLAQDAAQTMVSIAKDTEIEGALNRLEEAVDQLASDQLSEQLPAGLEGENQGTADGGEGDDPGFLGRVARSINECRSARCELSLILLELANLEDLILETGVETSKHASELIVQGISELIDREGPCFQVDDHRFAITLLDCDRPGAVEAAKQAVQGLPGWIQDQGIMFTLMINAGVATVAVPPRNFPAEELVRSAERCLYSATVTGGGVVKSIDVL